MQDLDIFYKLGKCWCHCNRNPAAISSEDEHSNGNEERRETCFLDCLNEWVTRKQNALCWADVIHRSTTKQMHTLCSTCIYKWIQTHTRTGSCILASMQAFFHGSFHFTWSCDMAMISILSFWLVIALSSPEHCERGKSEKNAHGPLEGQNDNMVRVGRQNWTGKDYSCSGTKKRECLPFCFFSIPTQ